MITADRFRSDLEFGEAWERKVADAFNALESVRCASKVDHRKHPYDLRVSTYRGFPLRVEVKAHNNVKGYSTFYLETKMRQDGSKKRPEWMTGCDLMVHVDTIKGVAFLFDARQLSKQAHTYRFREIAARNGSSMGILVEWRDPEWGFLGTIDLW